MIERILPAISDTRDYLDALAMFKMDKPLTAGEVEKILSLYIEHSEQVNDRDYAKLCLAVDLLPGRTREDMDMFASLELGAENLEALFAIEELVMSSGKLEDGQVEQAMEMAENEAVGFGERVMLVRTALDIISGARNFAAYREQAAALAAFLTSLGPETLSKYTDLVWEVRRKCR